MEDWFSIKKFLKNVFLVQDNYVKRHDVDGVTYKLSILDTAGQDEFSAFREVYYRSGDGFILVCSFGDESSLREIRQFHSQVRRVREGKNIFFLAKFYVFPRF